MARDKGLILLSCCKVMERNVFAVIQSYTLYTSGIQRRIFSAADTQTEFIFVCFLSERILKKKELVKKKCFFNVKFYSRLIDLTSSISLFNIID